ncbi:MAG: glycosyltransferase [Gloeomargarita sp. GMQP_bins_120]
MAWVSRRDQVSTCPMVSPLYRICFVGGSRYQRPLNPTQRKKFVLLSRLGPVHVIGFSRDWQPRFFQEEAYFYLLPNWPWPPLRYIQFLLVVPPILLWLVWRQRIQVVIAQSPYEALAVLPVKKLAQLAHHRLCLVVESHNDFENYLFLQRRVWWPGLYKGWMRWVARLTLGQADVLRAVSRATADQLQAYAPGRPMVTFIAWTDLESFYAAGDAVGETAKELTVVYAGVLIPCKGLHHLVAAFGQVVQQVPSARLTIIGRPENRAYAQGLTQQVRQAHLQEHVAFLPEMPQQQLAAEMARSTVLVLPSLAEALGRVLLEAMATGTPVVASAVGGIPDVVRDGVNGFLVPPGDEAALARRLVYLLRHPEAAHTMGQRGRQMVKTFFSPERYYQGYADLCRLCLGR